ncbi:CHAT domain-containing protein [Ancylothrix sp. C2]|uniref:CHAT domain-containing protein n=1 Tax=Ancylothrix sp. D3o TaxID=2953691 RepID=UPI0021BB221E|nr:CHAT domain-containing protein [Ancylothrix sp. D3o]MCT7953143.1 CHAT domain-containing protein [Ancylothrix sp. D3o]
MNSTVTKTLLALLLALRELETALSSDEQSVLQDVGQQLEIDPDYWDFIEEQLIAVIEANSALNQLYQYNKAKLETLDGQIPRELLPSLEDLNRELFPEVKEVITFDGQPKDSTATEPNEAIALTSVILKTENQDQAAKQVSFLKQVSDYVKTYRFFNTYFCDPKNQTTVPPSEPLIHGQVYKLFIDISPEQKGIDAEPTPFPDEALAQVWNEQQTLTIHAIVTAKNEDFSIDAQVKQLTLPRSGASDQIKFTVKPNRFEGRGYIRVELFYRGYLLQSKQIAVLVVPTAGSEIPESLRPPQSARITFTTTNLLSNEQLALLPERILAVNVELDTRDGSIDFRFLDRTQGDRELAFYDTTLQPTALGNAIAGIRQQLCSTLIEGYYGLVEGSLEQLNTWLPRLADAGHELYRQILPQKQGLLVDEQGEVLQAALKSGTIIQVNPVLGKVTIPWGLLYERKVKPSKRTSVCEHFTKHDLDCTNCPNKNNPNFVCPHGFWGYRYSIEQLPCWVSNKHPTPSALVRQIQNELPLYLSFNVWREFNLWGEHQEKLKEAGSLELLTSEEIQQIEMTWEAYGNQLDLVYFYCHGGVEETLKRPYLEVSDDRIYSNFLECYESTWKHHPLVFLNGCATGDYGPESYVSLIDDFLNAGASGVVGTECPVSEPFAEHYATEVLRRLFAGEPMGQAMLTVRQELLQRYFNPLGLVYSLSYYTFKLG